MFEKIKGHIPRLNSGQSKLDKSPSKRPNNAVHDDQKAPNPDKSKEDQQPSRRASQEGGEFTTNEISSSRLAYQTREDDPLEKLVEVKEKDNKHLTDELREQETKFEKLTREKDEIEGLLSQSKHNLKERADKLQRQHLKNKTLEEEILDLKYQLQQKSSQIQNMSEELDIKSMEIEFQKRSVRDLQSQIVTLQTTENSLRLDLKSIKSQKLQREQMTQNEINKFKILQQDALVTIKQLQVDAEEYSSALLKRDGFTPATDRDMKSKFRELSQDVETLARIEWKDDQTVWTQRALHIMSPHQQSFKKQVLQDMIWGILQQYIFASPFRLFGEEGRKLETEWRNLDSEMEVNEDIGGVYRWPKPSAEIERWRYVNVTEGRAALTQATISELDPRRRLKTASERTINTLRKELASSLEEIVGPQRNDSHYLRTLEELPKKAVNVWLEFGMQRCRIRVVIKGPHLTSVPEKIQQAKAGGWELLIIPELQRIGTAKGLELDAKPYCISEGQHHLVVLVQKA